MIGIKSEMPATETKHFLPTSTNSATEIYSKYFL